MIGVFPWFRCEGDAFAGDAKRGKFCRGGGKAFDLQEQMNESAFRFVRFFDV